MRLSCASGLAARLVGSASLCALIAVAFGGLAADGARAANRPPTFVRSCTIEAPDPRPLFSAPATQKPDEEDDDDDQADSDDDDDDDDPPPRGFISPGSSACIAISGTVNAGFQRDEYRANALTRATGQVPPNLTSFPLSTTFRIESGQSVGDGLYLATAFEFSVDTNTEGGNDLTLSEASVTFGAFAFGLASSRFDFWTGDEFAFIGRIPSRTVALIGYERQITESLSLSLSAEDISADQRVRLLTGGQRVPDAVARLLYEGGSLTLHGAVALREVPRLGAASLVGRAAILGATWEATVLERSLTITGQIAGAVNAPPYIGSQLDRRSVLPLLTGEDTTRGWSGVVSVGRDWTDDWSSNAYVSRYDLSLPPSAAGKNQIRIDRVAANIVWAPVEGLRIGAEASVAWQRTELAGRTIAASFSGRQSSAQVFIERTF